MGNDVTDMRGDQQPCAGSGEVLLPAGDTLIHEGELGDTAYCIVEGEVKVWKQSESGAVELARLGPGAIFGEMSIVDEKPRSASITALTTTKLKELKRTQFLESFQHDSEFAISLLRVLFERLRETGAKLTQLQQIPSPSGADAPRSPFEASTATAASRAQSGVISGTPPTPSKTQLIVTLEGLTEPAREALPVNPYRINQLPCRIGRISDDKLAYNDLTLPDFEPYQVSVNHLLIFMERRSGAAYGRIGIFDRGSSRGSWLNGVQLGGLMADDNATYLELGESELVLGDQESIFRFRITIVESNSMM